MGPVLAWFRLDVRRRWRSMLVLALLIAVASGTVMTALAGALRGASAADRLLEQTLPVTVEVLPNDPEFDWDLIRDLPQVAAVGLSVWTAYEIDGVPGELPLAAGDDVLWTVERPVVLEGRLADLTRPDEAVVTPGFVETYGKGVGDTVIIALYEPETLDKLRQNPDLAPDGPSIPTQIVGVVRSFLLTEGPENPGVTLIPSAGLFAEYTPNLLGASGASGMMSGLVRLDGGGEAISGFATELTRVTGRSDIDIWSHTGSASYARNISGFEANALLAFAVAAAVAAVFLVGQAVARYAASVVAEMQVLRSVGLTPWASRLAANLGPALAAVAGTMLGTLAAILGSRSFPYGTAWWLEPSPGIDVDLRVLVPGLLGVPLLVAAGATSAAWFAERAARRSEGSRRSATVSAAARAGAPVPAVVGARFAFEPGEGRRAVPVRPALFGAVVGVTGVLAALTFSSGIDDAAANPARYGQVHQLEATLGSDGEDFVAAGELLRLIAADPDVVAVNDSRSAVAQYAGVPTTVFTLDPVGRAVDAVVTSGRLPSQAHEVALGPFVAREAGVSVGDTIELAGARATRELTVTGLGFVPEGELNYYSTGSWVTPSAYDELFDGYLFRTAHIVVDQDADPAAVLERLREAAGEHGALIQLTLERSAEGELMQIRRLPIFLAGFLAVLAIGAVGHALATGVRRRGYDIAVLRAIGMTRWQSRGVVATQASALALVGVVVGVPLGVALGRTVWRFYAETAMVHYLPPVAAAALVLAVPVALLAANLVAVWPSHRASSMRIASVLRAE